MSLVSLHNFSNLTISLDMDMTPSGSVVIFNGTFIMQTLKTQLFKDMMLLCSISFTQNQINIKYLK